jgi:hypothetical protein
MTALPHPGGSPESEEDRVSAASTCVLQLDLRIPMVLDDMGDSVNTAYNALPERLYLLDSEGRIIFRTYPGTWNFDIDAWENAIRNEIERISE